MINDTEVFLPQGLNTLRCKYIKEFRKPCQSNWISTNNSINLVKEETGTLGNFDFRTGKILSQFYMKIGD